MSKSQLYFNGYACMACMHTFYYFLSFFFFSLNSYQPLFCPVVGLCVSNPYHVFFIKSRDRDFLRAVLLIWYIVKVFVKFSFTLGQGQNIVLRQVKTKGKFYLGFLQFWVCNSCRFRIFRSWTYPWVDEAFSISIMRPKISIKKIVINN